MLGGAQCSVAALPLEMTHVTSGADGRLAAEAGAADTSPETSSSRAVAIPARVLNDLYMWPPAERGVVKSHHYPTLMGKYDGIAEVRGRGPPAQRQFRE